MLSEIFSTDRKLWTGSQCDQVFLFFQYNSFFSKFYQKQDFQNLIGMCYYAKVQKKSSLILQNNKKSQALILLSGKVDIFKKVYRQKVKKIKKSKNDKKQSRQIEIFVEYQLFKTLTKQSETVNLDFDCRVSSLDDNDAEILYVPGWMYEKHTKVLENRKIELILKELINFYPKVQRKSLINLAKHGCQFKQLKINDYVYKIGSQPLEVYLLLYGTIRLQKQKISQNRSSIQAVNVQSPSLFGDKDIKLPQRISSAIICSAYAKILAINKKQFLKLMRQNHLSFNFNLQPEQKDYRLPLLKSTRKSLDFLQQQNPKMTRFKSSNQIAENEKLIEMKLMRDCHVLVNLSPKKSRTSRFDSNKKDNSKDFTKDQFQQKMKLFHKIRPNAKKIDINNPIINLVPTRGYVTFRNSLGNISD